MTTFINEPSPGWLHISTVQKHVRSETDRLVQSIPNYTQSNNFQQYTKTAIPNKHNTIKHTIDMRKWNHPILAITIKKVCVYCLFYHSIKPNKPKNNRFYIQALEFILVRTKATPGAGLE